MRPIFAQNDIIQPWIVQGCQLWQISHLRFIGKPCAAESFRRMNGVRFVAVPVKDIHLLIHFFWTECRIGLVAAKIKDPRPSRTTCLPLGRSITIQGMRYENSWLERARTRRDNTS